MHGNLQSPHLNNPYSKSKLFPVKTFNNSHYRRRNA